jgi:hypothetical protein
MKKILFFLLLFVNLHVFITDDGLQFQAGTTAAAQHIYLNKIYSNEKICYYSFCSLHLYMCNFTDFIVPISEI